MKANLRYLADIVEVGKDLRESKRIETDVTNQGSIELCVK